MHGHTLIAREGEEQGVRGAKVEDKVRRGFILQALDEGIQRPRLQHQVVKHEAVDAAFVTLQEVLLVAQKIRDVQQHGVVDRVLNKVELERGRLQDYPLCCDAVLAWRPRIRVAQMPGLGSDAFFRNKNVEADMSYGLNLGLVRVVNSYVF